MGNPILGRDFINLRDFTPEQFRYLLDLAHELKAEKRAGVDQRRFVNKRRHRPVRMGLHPHPLRFRDLLPRPWPGLHLLVQLPRGRAGNRERHHPRVQRDV